MFVQKRFRVFPISLLFAAAIVFALLTSLVPTGSAQETSALQPGVEQGAATRKLVHVEVIVNGKANRVSRRFVCFSLGKELGLAMNLKLRSSNPETAESALKWCKTYSESLGLELGEPPKITGMGEVWAVRAYLIGKENSVRAEIEKRHSKDCASLFELAISSMLSPLLYDVVDPAEELAETQTKINTMVLNSLKISSVNSKFIDVKTAVKAMTPLVSWIQEGKPGGEELGQPMKEVLANVKQLLLDEMDVATKTGNVVMADLAAAKDVAKPATVGTTGDGPNAAALIKVLRDFYRELQQENWEAASRYVKMPPGVPVTALSGLGREFSTAGIDLLEQKAKLQTAIEAFGRPRASAFADKMKAEVDQCYGFNFSNRGATAEVVAEWADGKFLIVRADDIAKIVDPLMAPKPGKVAPVTTAPSTSKSNAKLASKLSDFVARPPAAPDKAMAEQVSALAAEVERKPDDATLRAKYGRALAAIGSYPNAWEQLAIASKKDLKNREVMMGVDETMEGFKKLGIFTVGVPKATVEGLLGEPRLVRDIAIGKRHAYAHYAIDFKDDRVFQVINLRGSSNRLFQFTEKIKTGLDGRNWMQGLDWQEHPINLAILFLPGEMISNHTERVEIERLLDGAMHGSMKEIGAKLIALEASQYPESMHKILQQDQDSMIMAVKLPAAGSETLEQHKLVKLIHSKPDLHRLTYVIKSNDPPSVEVQKKWLKIFQDAKLEAVSQ